MPSDVFLIEIPKSSKRSHSHDDRVLLEMMLQKHMQDPWCALRSDSRRLEKERTCRTRREGLETSAQAHIKPSPGFFWTCLFRVARKNSHGLTVSLCSEFVDVSADIDIEPVHFETMCSRPQKNKRHTAGP
jgi:hypothetical protein